LKLDVGKQHATVHNDLGAAADGRHLFLFAAHRLWSCFPYMRPMASITHETIQYGIDKDGASVHDVIGSRWLSQHLVV
jgi:uncharacterized protein YcgI (DUF1989 family)